jgi:hypothetical protein
MKLQLTTYKKTYTIETENDDLDIDEYFDIIIGLLIQAGFHKETIDRTIIELSDELKEEQDA